MTLRELVYEGEQKLSGIGIKCYKSDVRLMIMKAFDLSMSEIILVLNNTIDDEEGITRFREYMDRRLTRYPCQYILGTQNFMGYDFIVREGVLIPRPETEILVETIVNQLEGINNLRVLDMCTGSGCIGIAIKLLRMAEGYNTEVVLADISDKALDLASDNNKMLEADCSIVNSDLFTNVSGKYNVIVSNPPYIKTADISELMDEVREYEPRLALDGDADGLFFYRSIIEEAANYLEDNGRIYFEIGYDQYEEVRILLEEAGYSGISLIKDYAGLDRVVYAYFHY